MNMPLAILNRRRRGFTAFSPASLFSLNEPGVWYDPSDLSTLFQDPAGTTPVTAPGNTVGLMLDKSKGGVGTNGASRRNLFERTQEIDNAYWTKDGATTPTTNNIAPDGTATAETLAETATTGVHGTYRVPAGALVAGAYVFSCYLKQGTVRYAHLLLNTSAGYSAATFDLQDGAVTKNQTGGTGVTSPSAPTIVSVGDGWYRATITATTSANINAVGPLLSNSGTPTYTSGGGVSYSGSTANNILIWGAQLELGSTASAYQRITSDWPSTMAGNHATQATAAARPTYSIEPVGGRRNLLTYSEDFRNTAAAGSTRPWAYSSGTTVGGDTITFPTSASYIFALASFSVAAGQAVTISFEARSGTASTLSAGLNGGSNGANNIPGAVRSLTSTWTRYSATFTGLGADSGLYVFFGNNGFTSQAVGSVELRNAQLELGSTATNYQRVTTQYDVTEAGVASVSYLYFDGGSDAMATSTITPGIDKVQVFAGVRKLNDTLAIAAEFSPSLNTSNGSFLLLAPLNSGASGDFVFRSKGTALSDAASISLAPASKVFTGLGDISGDRATLRLNGTQVAQTTTDQGTGNYLAYPLYLGARSDGAFPFNGHLYSLITRFGATLDAPTIANTEAYVAGKTGIVI
jgi:hypothetical protein